ncbi:MAG TPA: nuclear transport factor 2 family protein [Bacteroidales bacterium]|nr:nuclear transport factor 2 family protein [Bacteroidales bacterium]
MKKLVLSIFMISSVMLYSQETEKKTVNDFIDEWHQDAANVDREAYFGKIDAEGIFIGTDATEIWTRQEFYDWAAPQFADGGKAWDFKAIERNIYFGEKSKYAWFDELLSFSGGTLRGSGVLVKRKDGWKIMHYVLSLPVPNDKFGDVLKAMKEE